MLRVFAAALRTVMRGFGWTFVVLAVLLAGGAAYVHNRFGPQEARRLVIGQLQALFHREVAIERLVFTPRGVKLRGLRVRSGKPGGEADLLVCDAALVTVKLDALLRRRLELNTVRLDSPQIALVRDADGVWDLAELFLSSGAARPAGALQVSLAAAELIVRDGRLRLDDRLNGRRSEFQGFNLRFDDLRQDGPFPVAVSFVQTLAASSRTFTAVLSAEGAVDLAGLRWSSATARVDRFSAEVDGASFAGSGLVIGFARSELRGTVSAPALGPELWKRWAGRELPLSLPATSWNFRLLISSPTRFEFTELSVQTPAGVVAATASFTLEGSSPSLNATLWTKDAELAKSAAWHPSWAARAPRGRASLRLSLTGWPGRLQARDAELSLRGFGASWRGRAAEGMDLDASASDEFSELRARLDRGSVAAYGARFDEIAALARVSKQTLTVDSLALRWGGSRLKLRARVDQLSAPKEVLVSGTLDKLVWEDAHALVAAVATSLSTRTATTRARPWVRTIKYAIPRGFPDTAGHLRITELRQENFWCKDLDLLWSLRGITPQLNKAAGEARVRFGPGRVNDIPAVQDAHKFLRVIFLPFIYMHKMNSLSVLSTATAYPKTLDFRRIEAEYSVAGGAAVTRYFHVDSGQLAAFAEGTADFGREKVDMNILTRLASTRAPLPEWWVDEAGRPAIGFRVKGDLNRPELEPRFKKIGVDEIERRAEEGRASGQKRFEAVEKLRLL